MKVQGGSILVTALVVLATIAVQASRTNAAPAPDAERAAVESVLAHAGLLADPFSAAGETAAFGTQRVTQHLHASAPVVRIAWGAADAQGRPRVAVVTVQRWVSGTLEIRATDARGRDQLVSKTVRDSCARQVTLRRAAAADDPAGDLWRVTTVSALVGSTTSGAASLPLVDLHTHGVSSGFLSTLSDLDELAVYPQNCAVTASGDSVRVFVGGLEADAAVCVFAGRQRVVARRRDGSHAEATVRMDGNGLGQIGVTVYSGRTLSDAAAPAESRTWVLPILVGAPPPPAQEYFSL